MEGPKLPATLAGLVILPAGTMLPMFSTFKPPPLPPRTISPIEDAIADIRAGKMVILMDDESRENEGDLCMAADQVTADAINFMAKYGRGLICLALTEERIRELGLPMMVNRNRSPLGTAFTVSIDAKSGITSGVTAQDRATTIRIATRPDSGAGDLVSPGHVFPLRARRGGVLVRTGQTEGGVDLARLAGCTPASVICEIMKDDGSMARLPDLEMFAAQHDLKICTVADLIHYRLQWDSLVHRVAEAVLPTAFGEFRALAYRSDVDPGEHLALVRGDVRPDEPVLVRAHTEYLPGDVFGSVARNTGALLRRSMELIAREGTGVIVYLRREEQGVELLGGAARSPPPTSPSTKSSDRAMGFREYGIGAQILRDVGVGKIRLLTNNPQRLVSLPGYGLDIVEAVPLEVGPAARVPQSNNPRKRSSSKA